MLVARIAQTGHVEQAMSRGVGPEHFVDPECRAIWDFIREHATRYRAAPSLSVVRERFPDHGFEVTSDSTEYVIDRFMKHVRRRMAIDALRELAGSVDDDQVVGRIDELFLERARQLSQAVPSPRASRLSEAKQRIDRYHELVRSGAPMGIPMGIPRIDERTLGVQPHELVSIAGWQGTGKSTLLAYVLYNAWLNGRDALLFSLEMEAAAIQRKFDVMATNVQHRAMKAGKLGDDELELWEEWAERASSAKNDIVVIDDVGRCTVDRVHADMVKYKPDIVGLDYVSLMHTREGQAMWEKVTFLTGALKQTARSLGIPIVICAQTNIGGAASGAQLENIAYARSVGQDSDIALGLHRDREMEENRRMRVELIKNRDGARTVVDMHWEPERMRFHEATAVDLFPAREDQA